MITTKNAVFLHIAKTAGIWVRDILAPITVSHKFHAIPTAKLDCDNVFVFVRNPWDWYTSFYQFHNHGSETFNQQDDLSPIIRALPEITFETFIKYANEPTVEFKKRVLNLTKLFHMTVTDELKEVDFYIHETWIDSNKSYYNHIHDLYTTYATRVGTVENIREDLIDMLKQCGELTPILENNIRSSTPVNITYNKQPYQNYYTPELKEIVQRSNSKIITSKGYIF